MMMMMMMMMMMIVMMMMNRRQQGRVHANMQQDRQEERTRTMGRIRHPQACEIRPYRRWRPSMTTVHLIIGIIIVLCAAASPGRGAVVQDAQPREDESGNRLNPLDAVTGNALEAPLVNNVFFDTDLQQALADISAQTGVTIVADPTVQGLVTAELIDVPLERALRLLLSGGGYVFRDFGDYFLVGSPDPQSPAFLELAETTEVRVNYIEPQAAIAALAAPLRPYASPNNQGRSVAITAPTAILERIAADLRRLDRRPQQIILEARVVELASRDLIDMGVDWTWIWQSPNQGQNVRTGSVMYDTLGSILGITYTTTAEFTRELTLQLTLLEENRTAAILANPRVTVIDGEEAIMKVATEEYFQITESGTTFTRVDLEVVEAGVTLRVRPRIGEDGEITMLVSPEVSNVVARRSDDLPVITSRTATTTVRVSDGGTAVIAGLVSSISDSQNSQVPGLGDVPGLGALFRRSSTQEDERQVAVFVTPRIIDPDAPPDMPAFPRAPASDPVGEEFREEIRRFIGREGGISKVDGTG